MTKPRVLFVGRTRYSLPLPPATARKWEALGAELEFRVLASNGGDGGAHGDPRFQLVPPLTPRLLDGVAFYALLPWRIVRAARRFRPDVIVAEDPHVAAAALVAQRFLPEPLPRLIGEVHGNWRLSTRLHGSSARRLIAPLVDRIDAAALRRVDAVRALSRYTASLAEGTRGRPVDATFPTYSDLGAFTKTPRRPLPARPTALFVGVLEPYKNVDGLVAAWRSVARQLPNARLVVVGRGTQRPLVDALARELPGQVEQVAELPPDGVARALDDATTLVLPSRFEGLGRVVIESFARGRGVVGSAAGGILDLVRDGVEGVLIDPEDVDALAAALVRVLSDPQFAAALGEAAARRYEEWHSTPEEFAARFRALVAAALD